MTTENPVLNIRIDLEFFEAKGEKWYPVIACIKLADGRTLAVFVSDDYTPETFHVICSSSRFFIGMRTNY